MGEGKKVDVPFRAVGPRICQELIEWRAGEVDQLAIPQFTSIVLISHLI